MDKFESIQLRNLDIDTAQWKRFRSFNIYPEDNLSFIYYLTIGYIQTLSISRQCFDSIMGSLLERIAFFSGISYDYPHSIKIWLGPLFETIDDRLCQNAFLTEDLLPRIVCNYFVKQGVCSLHKLTSFIRETEKIEEFSSDLLDRVRNLRHAAYSLKEIDFSKLKKDIFFPALDDLPVQLEKWLNRHFKSKRNVAILMIRNGWTINESLTLEEIAEQNNISRERVRQICARLNSTIEDKKFWNELKFLWTVITPYIDEHYILHAVTISQMLQDHFHWSQNIHAEGWFNLIRLNTVFNNYAIDRDNMFITSFQFHDCCVKCGWMINQFERIISSSQDVLFDSLVHLLRKNCQKSCQFGFQPIWNADLVRFLLLKDEYQKKYRVDNRTVYTIEGWKVFHGSLRASVEFILKLKGIPLHFNDIFSLLKTLRDDSFEMTPEQVHAAATRAANVLLWGRGTFLHKSSVPFPYHLIRKVEKWLKIELAKGAPFISIYGFFKEFSDECKRENITNETALYSCLKISADPDFVYPRIPYVYLKSKFEERIPILVHLENYLLEAGGTITRKEISSYATKTLHVKSSNLGLLIDSIPHMVKVDRGKLSHKDYVQVFPAALEPVISFIRTNLATRKSISVKKVFKDKIVSCKAAGVRNDTQLFYIIKEYYGNLFVLKHYPYIWKITDKDDAAYSIRAAIVDYIKNKQSMVPYQEIEQEFVQKKGCSPQIVHSISNHPSIRKYLPSCLIHEATLGLTDSIIDDVIVMARDHYFRCQEQHQFFARVEDLIENNELPDLNEGFYWTENLVADIITDKGDIRLLGNCKNAYVTIPNEYEINNMEDLVEKILIAEFQGAANYDVFSERMHDLGIVQKSLTSSMLGEGKKVVIENQEIILKKLLKHAHRT
ncbi:sigma factor-like helix-turn-helix DNA-binding protein [candidate division CSSED10-310 bacterium]|uniref:Sigma factor-like helix-turn-helix DNA-binding protein n=1 Tax=candidate division CSSED10-310 bacterium TaxID=2855610 RepID=A0ABV6YSE8_UNCC1